MLSLSKYEGLWSVSPFMRSLARSGTRHGLPLPTPPKLGRGVTMAAGRRGAYPDEVA